jgi:hypothetical protein
MGFSSHGKSQKKWYVVLKTIWRIIYTRKEISNTK